MVNTIPDEKRHIVCAANRYGDLIICAPRHHDPIMNGVLDALRRDDVEMARIGEQGFVDQFGEFHDRVAALRIVKVNGQLVRDPDFIDELFSENLY